MVEVTQMSIIDKRINYGICQWNIFSCKKEWCIDICYKMDKPWEHLNLVKGAKHKGHILYDSIDIKCPKEVNPKRQKADYYLPGDGGRETEKWLLTGLWFLLGVMKMSGIRQWLQLHNLVDTLKKPQNCNFKMANFMIWELYLNLKVINWKENYKFLKTRLGW